MRLIYILLITLFLMLTSRAVIQAQDLEQLEELTSIRFYEFNINPSNQRFLFNPDTIKAAGIRRAYIIRSEAQFDPGVPVERDTMIYYNFDLNGIVMAENTGEDVQLNVTETEDTAIAHKSDYPPYFIDSVTSVIVDVDSVVNIRRYRRFDSSYYVMFFITKKFNNKRLLTKFHMIPSRLCVNLSGCTTGLYADSEYDYDSLGRKVLFINRNIIYHKLEYTEYGAKFFTIDCLTDSIIETEYLINEYNGHRQRGTSKKSQAIRDYENGLPKLFTEIDYTYDPKMVRYEFVYE